MSATNPHYQLFVGIDIAAATATVAAQSAGQTVLAPLTIKQTPAGFAALQQRLSKLQPQPQQVLVVMEATSSYWVRLATSLHGWGYHVSVVNPKQAHDFAKAILQHAKTDPLDARMLALLAAKLTPARWTPPPAIYHQYEQRLTQRDNLLGMRQVLLNQQHALLHEQVVVDAVSQRQQALISLFDEQLRQVEAELAQLVAQDEEWGSSIVLLQSIPGIGLLSAAWLVVGTLNFSNCGNAEAASSYVGLAPQAYQSGSSVRGRGRIGHRGDGRLRTVLYMAALSAARYNAPIRELYERLRAAGKPTKVARCAAARKLLHLAWAVATKGVPFDPQYRQARQIAVSS